MTSRSPLPSPSLTPRQAAELLGVSESTVRRWCDRALVAAGRTTGRHRRIDQAELLAFAREAGLWTGGETVASSAGRGGRTAPLEELAARLEAALVAGDDAGVRALVAEGLGRGDPEALFDDVVAPAMRHLGDRWGSGELAVYEEHRASQLLLAALAHGATVLPRPAVGAPVAVCAALSGDPYAIAPAMAALVVQAERWRPVLLGPDTPTVEVIRAARAVAASMVVVSVGCVAEAAATAAELRALAEGARELGASLVVGGRGLDPTLRRGLAADRVGETMAELRAFAREQRARPGRGEENRR